MKFEDLLFLINYIQTNSDIQHDLLPVVLIRYHRSYFISQNNKVRATIDRALSYYKFQNHFYKHLSPVKDPAIILEVKYDKSLDDATNTLFQQIPFRMTKNSKYASAVGNLYY